MRVFRDARNSRKHRPSVLSVLVAMGMAVAVPLGPGTAAAQAQPAQRVAAYDHSQEKGMPGTHGPLPAGFSHTQVSVKFRTDRAVRLRDGKAVARDNGDTAAVQAVLAKYPGATMDRPSAKSEQAVDGERARLEGNTGRELPDLNSWFTINVPKGIEVLLDDLNRLPSVEIAIARPIAVATTVDPLRDKQVYRTSASAGSGIDADFAHSLAGGKGEGITVTDVEAGGRESSANVFGSVASGDTHQLMVFKDGGDFGSVRAWGGNASGQLGIGNTTNANVFMQVSGLTNVIEVAAGGSFSMALKSDGTVWTWGANANGQLGNSSTTNSLIPVQVSGLSTATSIAAGSNFAVAVLSDGTMRAWGANGSGQLGDGTTTQRLTPVTPTGVTGVSTVPGSVAAGTSHTLALKTTGAVVAWGANGSGQLGRNPTTTPSSTTALTVSGVTGATQLAAGSTSSYARLSSGAVSSWGANGSGQLGNGTTTNNFTPAAVPGLTSVATVSAGGSSAVVTRTDQTVRAWGLNSSGQLGIGSTSNVSVPTVVSLPPGAAQVAAGATQTVAVGYNPDLAGNPDAQTFIWAWGANASGQLGTGNTVASTSPVQAANIRNLWNTCHEDLANRPAPAGPPVRLQITTGSPCQPPGLHGTAAVGFVAAQDDNGLGIDGLLPKAKLQLVSGTDWQGSVALARTNSQPGDVIWFEVAIGFATGGFPWEWSPEIYDEIVTATAAGVTVVEPAANGGNSLDDPTDGAALMIMNRPDSGAIIVGAGEPSSNMPWTVECNPANSHPAPRTARDFSTYGTRVDLQGWANCITSLGSAEQHDLTPAETDPNKMYWSNMNGTSGASPMVVGAVGEVQGIVKQSGAPLTPLQVRALLKRTGSPQPASDTHHIGPLPNVRAAIDDVRGGTASGANHTLSARADGTVWTWGDNAFGQLGNGTTTSSSTPAQVTGLGEVRRGAGSIAGGATHSLAVRSDGTVWAWGQGTSGQLGNGGTANSSVPVQVSGLTGVVAVAAGSSFSAALKSDGTVWEWGANASGQLGDNTTTQRTTPVRAGTLTTVARISAGASHVLAVRTDGTAWAWGANASGQLGLSDTVQRNTPTQITGISGVSTLPGAVAAGSDHSLAVRADGTVAAWGSNGSGQLGLGDTTQRTSPTTIAALTGVAAVSAGTADSFALRTNGTASGWGANTNGQVGDNTTTQRTTPVAVASLTGAVGITAGSLHTVAVRPDGAVWSWGANGSGQLGNGTVTGAGPAGLTRINLSRTRSNVSTGLSHALVADPSGRVLAWGANGSGQLGNGTTSATSTPVQVWGVSNALPTPGGVAAGDTHSLAVVADGVVLAWGGNGSGQLGNNSTIASSAPLVVPGLSGVVAVAAGGAYSMALKSDGTVWTWGLNSNGQLGLGNTTNRLVPTQVTALSSVVSIGAGATFAFAVRSDGTVRSWGLNSSGQLGDGTTTQRTAPVTVTGLTGVSTRPGAVDGGSNHALAAKADGTVVAWGANASGQLGSNPATVASSLTAIAVPGLTAVARVGAGVQDSLAVRSDGTARTWGANTTGQLGNGSTTNSWPPVTVNGGLTALGPISGGSGFSATSQANGTVWTWGGNASGQLGNGNTTTNTSPVAVVGTP
jgi:alpha-tubulin suppressor-like RCC1 family protein